MKIGKMLRNLLMKQDYTFMLSRTRAVYLGETYTFDEVSEDEVEEIRLGLIKMLDKPSFVKIMLDKLLVKNIK